MTFVKQFYLWFKNMLRDSKQTNKCKLQMVKDINKDIKFVLHNHE